VADSIDRPVRDSAGSATRTIERAVIAGLGLRDAVEGALREAERSGLSGLSGGPGDAYRHLLITGEIRRRFGPNTAALAAFAHEIVNATTGSQTDRDEDMDNRNNSLVAAAPEFETWEDIVRWARGEIVEAAAHNGDGQEGRAFWYKKQPSDWRPDLANVPITPIERGGPEHRYAPPAAPDALITDPIGMADATKPATAPLERPVASWTEEDVRTVMNSPAYLEPQHPRRGEAERKVHAWFERRFGTRTVALDATGRGIREGGATAGRAGACPVPVRAQSRGGGKVEVGAHCRSMPAA